MKHFLITTLLSFAAISSGAQQINGDFSTWEDCIPWTSKGNKKAKGIQPQGWTISNVIGIDGTGSVTVGSQIKDGNSNVVELRNTPNSLKSDQIVPAYITLGTTWATSTGFNPTNKDGGTFGGIKFTNLPDSIKLRYKRTHAQTNPNEKASVIAYLWKGTWTQQAVPGNIILIGSSTKVDMVNRERNVLGIKTDQGGAVSHTANAERIGSIIKSIEGEHTEWTSISFPFTYNSTSRPEMLNVIISANDYFEPLAGTGNKLSISNVELIYNSSLSDLKYNGQTIPNFSKDNYVYEIKEAYTEGCLTPIKDGVGASTNISYNEKTGIATITVKGDDWSETNLNQHVYKVQFAIPVVTDYINDLTVAINNTCSEPQETTIQLIKEIDGSYSFTLNRFRLNMGGSILPVGDIKLTNLKVNGNVYTQEQTISIKASDDKEDWFGPTLDQLGGVPVKLYAEINDNQMIANIDIDMTNVLGQVIKVIFAPTTHINDGTPFDLNVGSHNISLNRTFPAGWNTICLPFAASASSFTWSTPDGYDSYSVQVQKFTSADANGLTFTELQEGEMMEANKPYLINFPADKNVPTYFGVNVASTTPVAVNKGDWSFLGTYTGLVAGEMTGFYGVMKNEQGGQSIRKAGAGASIKGTRAYFQYNGSANVNSIELNLEGETTGIGCIENGKLTVSLFPANIYGIDGRMVKANAKNLNGLSKGIYVVNGKKIIVK